MRYFKLNFGTAWLGCLMLTGCNASERSRLTESDTVRLFNQIVDARNAVWATPLKADTDFLRATTKLVDLKDSKGDNVDAKLRELRDTLIRLSERKLEIIMKARTNSKEIDDYNASGVLERVLSRSRIDNRADENNRLGEELKEISTSLDKWDKELEATRNRLKLTSKP